MGMCWQARLLSWSAIPGGVRERGIGEGDSMALRISEQPKGSLLSEGSPSHRTLKEALQWRLQSRRSREQQDPAPTLKDLSGLSEQQQNVESIKPEDSQRPKAQARTQPSDVVKMNILRDAMACPVRVKRTRLPQDLEGTALRPPAPPEALQKNVLSLSPTGAQARHGSLADGRAGPSDGRVPLAVDGVQNAALTPGRQETGPPQRAVKGQRPRRVKDTKLKARKLKYHLYVPPDQKSDPLAVPSEAAYSQLLQQQQIFLQLQIVSQQHTVRFQPLTSGLPGEQIVGVANAGPTPAACVPLSPVVKGCPRLAGPGTAKPELLPNNLDELTVSELRQQLRKRGLPVSGTKPVLLERLRPFQVSGPSPGPLPARGVGGTPPGEDGGPAERDQAFRRLLWTLEEGQGQVEDLQREMEMRPRAKSQPGAPAPSAEPVPNLEQPSSLESGPPRASCAVPLQDGYLSDLLGAHPLQTDFSYSPFLTPDESDSEARTETSLDERFESEVYLCDCLGSAKGEQSSLDTFDYCTSGAFQSLDDDQTEAIQNAQLSHSQSIEDLLNEHFMETDSPPSHTSPIGSSLHPGVGEPLAPDADALEGPLGSSPGDGGRSPLTFDAADWLEPLPGATLGGFRAGYVDAPGLSVDLLVGQW